MGSRLDSCICYVSRLADEERFTLRWGAHDPSCPAFRPSGDPVDAKKDAIARRTLTLEFAAIARSPIKQHDSKVLKLHRASPPTRGRTVAAVRNAADEALTAERAFVNDLLDAVGRAVDDLAHEVARIRSDGNEDGARAIEAAMRPLRSIQSGVEPNG